MAFQKALTVTYPSPYSLFYNIHRSVHHSTLTREVFFLLYILTNTETHNSESKRL